MTTYWHDLDLADGRDRSAMRRGSSATAENRERPSPETAPDSGIPIPSGKAFWSKFEVAPRTGCWIWTGQVTRDGYGQVKQRTDRWLTHRLSYEILVGPIPEGLTLDHLCRVTRCINPDHLEPVTALENLRRAVAYRNRCPRTHCPKGHEMTPENTETRKDTGGRRCRTCRHEANVSLGIRRKEAQK